MLGSAFRGEESGEGGYAIDGIESGGKIADGGGDAGCELGVDCSVLLEAAAQRGTDIGLGRDMSSEGEFLGE